MLDSAMLSYLPELGLGDLENDRSSGIACLSSPLPSRVQPVVHNAQTRVFLATTG